MLSFILIRSGNHEQFDVYHSRYFYVHIDMCRTDNSTRKSIKIYSLETFLS